MAAAPARSGSAGCLQEQDHGGTGIFLKANSGLHLAGLWR